MRTLVLGDVHGANRALEQVLDRCNFDYENDLLISLGDIADGWSEVKECVDTLLKIKNLIVIRGNHDDWFITWLTKGHHPCDWLQGGEGTLKSYAKHSEREITIEQKLGGFVSDMTIYDIDPKHVTFWNSMMGYIIKDNRVFVHGGFDRTQPIEIQSIHKLMWDRNLIEQAIHFESQKERYIKEDILFRNANHFDEIFLGHTATTYWKDSQKKPIFTPIHAANVWDIDTGAGWSGYLTIMDADTKEYWQSDNVKDLYHDEKGRSY